MTAKLAIPLLAVFALAGCRAEPEAQAPAASPEAAAAPAASAPAAGTAAPAAAPAGAPAPADTAASSAPAAAPAAAPTAGQAASVLASQETNWPGIVAEIIEFRRKGNTLTARVRIRNQGGAPAQPEIKYEEVAVMDLAAGKKYEVLKDERGTYIAGLRSGWTDRWYQSVEPGQSQLIWMKFPAPPAEVKAVTLQLPGTPPFEDLPIQDS
jgi:nucleoid-associated protein YgaU